MKENITTTLRQLEEIRKTLRTQGIDYVDLRMNSESDITFRNAEGFVNFLKKEEIPIGCVAKVPFSAKDICVMFWGFRFRCCLDGINGSIWDEYIKKSPHGWNP